MSTSYLTKIIPIPISKFWNSQTIPIPICTEVGFANLFLFLFAGKMTICWSLVGKVIPNPEEKKHIILKHFEHRMRERSRHKDTIEVGKIQEDTLQMR